MTAREYFAVISGDPRYACEEDIAVFSSLGDAVSHRDYDDTDTRVVYVLREVSESALWDWSVDHGEGRELLCYVNERAARNSRHGTGVVVRRRTGTTNWAPAPEEGETP